MHSLKKSIDNDEMHIQTLLFPRATEQGIIRTSTERINLWLIWNTVPDEPVQRAEFWNTNQSAEFGPNVQQFSMRKMSQQRAWNSIFFEKPQVRPTEKELVLKRWNITPRNTNTELIIQSVFKYISWIAVHGGKSGWSKLEEGWDPQLLAILRPTYNS